MDEVSRVERDNGGVKKGFYTVSEAAKVLGVGQRRILEMLETKEIEGERDPTSSRWKILKHAVDKLAPEEPTDATDPLLSEESSVTEEDTVELPAAEEKQGTEEIANNKELLLGNQLPREDATARFSERSVEEIRKRISELEGLNERLQGEQQAAKTAWQEERRALLGAANREHQHVEELQKELARLNTELNANRELTTELEGLNERLQGEQQAAKTAWQEEKRSLLAAADRDRQYVGELQEEVKRLSTELETERSKRFWQRLFEG